MLRPHISSDTVAGQLKWHPGEFIQSIYMACFNVSCCHLVSKLDVAASTLNRILKQQSGFTVTYASEIARYGCQSLQV